VAVPAADSQPVPRTTARRLVGKKDFLIDLNNPTLVRTLHGLLGARLFLSLEACTQCH
jgi:hypothetical protein